MACSACLLGLALEPSRVVAGELPRALVLDALWRMRWVGLALAVTAVGVYVGGFYLQPGWVDPAAAPRMYGIAVLGIVLSGLALAGLASVRWRPVERALDAGLAVQVVTALCIGLSESSVAYGAEPVRSVSSVALWIVVFALAVPVRFGKALGASLAAASMVPVAMGVQVAVGNIARPQGAVWFIVAAPLYMIAVVAPLLGRVIYRLGAEVKRAQEFGGYRLVEKIGGGGMGEVWRARHHLVDREAAVKLIRPELLAGNADARLAAMRRFEREAKATAALHSPHVVSLYDYGLNDDGAFYYVMELLEGLDLETLVRRFGPMPEARVAHVLRQVCDALAEAHAAGLVHRDIKAANVVLAPVGTSGDFAKVLDFGLAQWTGEGSGMSAASVAGTPDYMAPEVLRGEAADARSDLYSLGCVGYWLLAGRTPFEGATAALVMQGHLSGAAEPLPGRVGSVVMRCLEKDPAARPGSAEELGRELEGYGLSWTAEGSAAWWTEKNDRAM